MKLKKINKFQISIDGGGSTGTSTGGKLISKKYGLSFLSSGLLYRYASYQIIKDKPKNEIIFLKKIFKNLTLKKLNKIDLHTVEISKHTSIIAKVGNIRKILKNFQINFAKNNKKCCIEGRDISTVILPKSELKFFFKCDLDIAARRRYRELKKKNNQIKFLEVKKALRIRNKLDIRRKNSPLLKHLDAIVIDTGKLGISSMMAKMSKEIDKKIKIIYGS